MKKIFITISSVIIFSNIFSQNAPCGFDNLIKTLKQNDSTFQQKLEEEEKKYGEWRKNSPNSRTKNAEKNEPEIKNKLTDTSSINKKTVPEPLGNNMCNGICPYNNTMYGPLASPTTINGISSISNMFGGEAVRVTGMIAGNTYRIYTCGQNNFDTQLTIYPQGGGQCIAFNDDACGTQSEIDFTPVFSGTYDILIDEWNSINGDCDITWLASTTIYVKLVYIQGTCGYNNSPYLQASAPVILYQTVSFTQTWAGEYNRVTNMIAGNTYRIYTCGNSAFDTQISIYSAGGSQAVAYNDDACNLQSEIYFTPLTTGNYDILLDVYPCTTGTVDMDVKVTLVYTPRPVITIPTVVHVVYNNATENISDNQIISQINVLNQDFRRLNSDISNALAPFKGISSDPLLEFCLAQRDPSGNPTNGITRTWTPYSDFANFTTECIPSCNTQCVFCSSSGGKDEWNRSQYFNIWVCNLGGNIGGVGFPMWNQLPSFLQGIGITLDYRATGTIGTATPPLDKGRIGTHETGHWLGLWHTFGNAGTPNNCGSDSIPDTPIQDEPSSGFPLNQTVTEFCSDDYPGIMYNNFMDYTDDDAKNMFTYWQTDRTDFALFNWYAGFQTSQGCVPPAIGINEVNYLDNISIFPNPNSGTFSIIQNDAANEIQVDVKNILGEHILKINSSDSKTEIDLSNQSNGIYFLQINSKNGTATQKLILQK